MFIIALEKVILTLCFIIPGFVLCKFKKAFAEHLSTMSSFLIYFCSPCMIISSFINLDYSVDNLINMAIFFGVTLVLQIAFIAILFTGILFGLFGFLLLLMNLIRNLDLQVLGLAHTVEFWSCSFDCWAFCFFNRFKLLLDCWNLCI